MTIDKAALKAAIEASQQAGRVQHAPPLGIEDMSKELKKMGITIAPTTLRFYMPGNSNQRQPIMEDAYQVSGRWLADIATVVKWAREYDTAEKRGRRGDGSARKSRKGK